MDCTIATSLVMLLGSYSSGLQLEFGVSQLSHLGEIQTFEFRLCRDALSHHGIDGHVDHKAHDEDDAEKGRDPDQLRHQLARIAIEQAGDGSVDAVP